MKNPNTHFELGIRVLLYSEEERRKSRPGRIILGRKYLLYPFFRGEDDEENKRQDSND
jgi:hypothetical protein